VAHRSPAPGSTCVECGEDVDVPIPSRLVEAAHAGQVLLFVGSGASTESHNVMPDTFYDTVAAAIGRQDDELPFPDLMSAYVARHSRSELITAFYGRYNYINTFPELHRRATRFQDNVGQVPFFREIVTTNWDDYFERRTGAVPLVVGPDFDYWDLHQRKVLKIHGSMLNPGSIVATRAEYDASLERLRSGALGAAVRHLMATRSVVFVGYSLRDDDIRDVTQALRTDLGAAARPCYFVHPRADFVPPIDNAEVINTSASWFVKLLDDALVDADILLPVEIYDRVRTLDSRLRQARTRFDLKMLPHKYPLGLFKSKRVRACRRRESRVRTRS